MDIKYPIENKYMKCVLQINGFSGLRPRVRSSRRVGSGRVRGGGGGGGGGALQDCSTLQLLRVDRMRKGELKELYVMGGC